MNLPAHIDGGAFRLQNNTYIYSLWAKTSIDRSETAKCEYSFPLSLKIKRLEIKDLNYSISKKRIQATPKKIQLTSSPIFLTPNDK
jgi:hypothetical protein